MSSTAEKLRALDEAIPRNIPHPLGMDLNESWTFTHREQYAILDLRNALPQLIAVVEAAERREDFAAPGVARLVAALDEALTVDGKTPE